LGRGFDLSCNGILSPLTSFHYVQFTRKNYDYPEISLCEEPSVRMEKCGVFSGLSDAELLSNLLGKGSFSLANELLVQFGSLQAISFLSVEQLVQFKGLGKVSAKQLVSVGEIARRVSLPSMENEIMDKPEKIYRFCYSFLNGQGVEKMVLLVLNRKNRLIKHVEISSGTATACLGHPREIFKEIFKVSGCAFCLAHNHPSGDPAASSADIVFTRTIREAARAMDVEFLDHVVIGRPARTL